jgi:hypothetical protein
VVNALRFFPLLPPGAAGWRRPFFYRVPVCRARRQDWIRALLAVRLLSVLVVGRSSGGLDTGHTGSASAMAWAQYCLLTVLDFAGVVIGVGMGDGVISAVPRLLAGPARPAPRILSVHLVNEGWSRPFPPLGGSTVGGGGGTVWGGISVVPESLAGPGVCATPERQPQIWG